MRGVCLLVCEWSLWPWLGFPAKVALLPFPPPAPPPTSPPPSYPPLCGLVGDTFSQKLTGFFIPPYTANYSFYIAGDDNCDLSLSTDEYEANSTVLASVVSNTR